MAGQDAGQRATVVVPTGSDATETIGRSKVTKPSTNGVGTHWVENDEETAALPTRVVAAPPIARRAWIVPAALAMTAVVGVAAWQGFGGRTGDPVPTNSASPVAPAVVPREATNSASVSNAAGEEPAVEEPVDAVDAEVAPGEDPVVSDAAPSPGTPRPAKPPAPPKSSVVVEPPQPAPEVHEMRPTPEPPGEGLTPAERRRLRKIADRIERERRRREAMRQNPDYRQP